MSGKRTRSFKCAVHHRDREVCSENDFHLLVHEPPLFRRYDYLIFYRHKTSFHLFSRRKPMFKRRKVVNRSMNILRIILHVRLDKDRRVIFIESKIPRAIPNLLNDIIVA